MWTDSGSASGTRGICGQIPGQVFNNPFENSDLDDMWTRSGPGQEQAIHGQLPAPGQLPEPSCGQIPGSRRRRRQDRDLHVDGFRARARSCCLMWTDSGWRSAFFYRKQCVADFRASRSYRLGEGYMWTPIWQRLGRGIHMWTDSGFAPGEPPGLRGMPSGYVDGFRVAARRSSFMWADSGFAQYLFLLKQ